MGNRTKKIALCVIFSACAVGSFWYAHRVKNYPKASTVSEGRITYFSPEEWVSFLEETVTKFNWNDPSLRAEYERAKSDLEQKKLASWGLVILGVGLLVGTGAMASQLVRRQGDQKSKS